MTTDEKMMARALQLARKGLPEAMPNPMVGAVITDQHGHVIGEGYHRKCGEAHAEVNAINSVADKELLKQSTIYVTLEPCAHYGRTAPCADLIVRMGIPKVVIGTRDPFDKVNGQGIKKLRDAGIEVVEDVLRDECRRLNAVFFTAHTHRRPFVMLKWAQSSDGYLSRKSGRTQISTPLTQVLMHRLRAFCDGILVGSGTVLADNPRLDTRLVPGKSPRPIILDRRGRIDDSYAVMSRNPIVVRDALAIPEMLGSLYEQGITSLLVEGGAEVLSSFVDSGVWDLARVEVSTQTFGDDGQAKAPNLPALPQKMSKFGENKVLYYLNNSLVDVKNI